MTSTPRLDHTVVNVRMDMDRAERVFAGLGFTVTPRGYHTLGSINHLMMFGTDYLELIGLPEGGEAKRPQILKAPLGLDGLVFKTADADAEYAHLQATGLAGDPPNSFSRPVDLGGEARDAKFRTVTVKPGIFPGGRVYYCEHGTPELVWRPEWQQHANGVTAIADFVVVSAAAGREAADFAKLLQVEATGSDGNYRLALDGATLSVLAEPAYRARFAGMALTLGARPSMFGAMSLRCRDLAQAEKVLRASPDRPELEVGEARILVRVPHFDTLLEFVAA